MSAVLEGSEVTAYVPEGDITLLSNSAHRLGREAQGILSKKGENRPSGFEHAYADMAKTSGKRAGFYLEVSRALKQGEPVVVQGVIEPAHPDSGGLMVPEHITGITWELPQRRRTFTEPVAGQGPTHLMARLSHLQGPEGELSSMQMFDRLMSHPLSLVRAAGATPMVHLPIMVGAPIPTA